MELPIWNLDFFRPFYSDLCLGIGILPTLALDYAIAAYPLLLMIISYLLIVLYDRNYRVITIIWMPFQFFFSLFKRRWAVRASLVDAFSTFFLLSNIKFLNVSFDLLTPTRVYHLYGDTYDYTYAHVLFRRHRILWERAPSLWHLGHSYAVCVCHPTSCHPCSLPICFLPEVPVPIPCSLVHPTHLCGLLSRLLQGWNRTRHSWLSIVFGLNLFLICRPVYMIIFYINRMSSNSNNQKFFPLCPLLIPTSSSYCPTIHARQ